MTIPKSLSISIDLNKIDDKYVVKGKDGARYLDLKLVNTPDNEYGNDYFVSQALPKNVREQIKESGADWPKTPILGNAKAWQCMEGKANGGARNSPTVETTNDMPF